MSLHPTTKVVESPLLILHWHQCKLFSLQFCPGNVNFQPDLMSLHYLRAHSLITTWHHTAPCKEMSDDARNQITSAVQHYMEQLLQAWLVFSGAVPYRCGDTISVPGATSSSVSPDIWHQISSCRLVLTVKFMNGKYQSTLLIHFTTYVSTKS